MFHYLFASHESPSDRHIDPDKDPKFKWDDRPAERGGQQYVDSPPSCEREFNGYSRTHEDTPAHGDLFLIVLCPSVFEVEEDVGPLSEIAREKLEPGEMATSDFANSLSETVIHELFHSSMFLGKEALSKLGFVCFSALPLSSFCPPIRFCGLTQSSNVKWMCKWAR